MKNRFTTLITMMLLVSLCAICFFACNQSSSDPVETTVAETTAAESPETTDAETEAPIGCETDTGTTFETETVTETGTETDTETEAQPTWEMNKEDLNEVMQQIFAGTTVKNETVMFIDKGDTKSLLYPIGSIQSVTSYDGQTVYEEGRDYVIVDGKLKVTENSTIPCITSANYYGVADSILETKNPDGEFVKTHWGQGDPMTRWQVCVNYTHSVAWDGYTQESYFETYKNLIKKMQAGEDVTIIFYGDSITYGANASWCEGQAPNQPSYAMLFTQALADLFDYTIRYRGSGNGTCRVPTSNYVAGTRGTITYVNSAVGGWTSQQGVDNLMNYLLTKVQLYGCDLLVLAFGMNDGVYAPTTTRDNNKKIIDAVLERAPEASVLMVSTMVPNPDATNGWYGTQPQQEQYLISLAKTYRDKGVACEVARMTAVSLDVLKHKEFKDYTGNNINHPNDFFSRVYAQVLLQALIGYENMN